jgi:DNA-binding NtrC family response regulator
MDTPLEKVVYTSQVMQELQQELKPVVDTAASLLFWGETGCGMGFLARMIHKSSSRTGAFLRIPGFTLDEDTVVQQLIGVDDQPGWLEEADKGTIFLKRISEASPEVQNILISVIGNQSVDGRLQFSRKGRSETREVNVRFIYSMAHDFKTALQDNLLRRNLVEMIEARGKILRLPPLRERKKDLLAIVRNFLQEFNRKYSRDIFDVDKAALALLTNYIWPGNIDELKRVIDNIFTQHPEITTITTQHIPEHIRTTQITGTEYSFKLKNDVKFKGQILSHFLRIQTDTKRLKLNTHDIAEIVRVEDTTFKPPKFKHFLFRFKDGNQITGTMTDKTLRVATSFDADYQITLQDVKSIYLM